MKANQTQQTGANGKRASVHTQARKPARVPRPALLDEWLNQENLILAGGREQELLRRGALQENAQREGAAWLIREIGLDPATATPEQIRAAAEANREREAQDQEFAALNEMEDVIRQVDALNYSYGAAFEADLTPTEAQVAGWSSMGWRAVERLQSIHKALLTLSAKRRGKGAAASTGGAR